LEGICYFEEDVDPPYLPLLEQNPRPDVCVQLTGLEPAASIEVGSFGRKFSDLEARWNAFDRN